MAPVAMAWVVMLWVVMARLAVAPVVIAGIAMTPVAVARAGFRHSVQRARIAAPAPLAVLLTLPVLRPPRGMTPLPTLQPVLRPLRRVAPLSGEVAALAVLPPQEMTPLSMLRPPQEVATMAMLLTLPLPQPLWKMPPVAVQAFLARRRPPLAARAQAAQGAVRDRAA